MTESTDNLEAKETNDGVGTESHRSTVNATEPSEIVAENNELEGTEENNGVVDGENKVGSKEDEQDNSKNVLLKDEANDDEVKKGTSPETKRQSRERKSAAAFKPDDFLNVDKSPRIIKGRGTALSKLVASRNSIENTPLTAEIFVLAHRLLYSGRGRLPKKDIKSNILRYSGFLSAEMNPDKEKQKELDMDEEAKMGQRAYKLKVSDIKRLCDFFAIDRSGAKDKDTLVDALLDFLGEPGENLLKHKGGLKGSAQKKRKSRKDDDEDQESDDETESEDYERKPKKIKPSPKSKTSKAKGRARMPSDGELRRWVNAYIMCHNMEKSTLKHAMEIAGEKFGVDLSSQKAKLKQFLAEAL